MWTSASASTASSLVKPSYDGHLAGTSHIPDDLINNILLCLPVKHLLRCRCVSKPWCSLIDSTTFVKKHLQRNIECNSNFGIVLKSEASFYLTNVDSSCDITAVEITDPLKNFLSGALFVGSCNGLVCLWQNHYDKPDSDIYLWNPIIRKATRLPKPPDHVPFPSLLQGSALVGFGYDPLNDDYKVVTAVDSKIWGIMVAVYSLKGNSWTRADTITTKYCINGHFGISAKGSVYWLATKDSKIIFAFDLGVERHRELPFPAGVNVMGVTVFNECLCLIDYHADSRMDIWLMNTNRVENSWSKLFSLEQPGIFGSFKFVQPLAFSKSQNDILLNVDDKFMWYDRVKNEVKNVTIDGFPVPFHLLAYNESLVQPSCNLKFGEPQKNKIAYQY